MNVSLGWIDLAILFVYSAVLIVMGWYFSKKSRTAEQFMVAGRNIPSWAVGLAVMSTYTSSISYIATPGKSFDTNWHPIIFSICIFPVAWVTCRYVVPFYRKLEIISVYEFLEHRLGVWARIYAAFSFLLFMIGRVAVILYLVSLLLCTFVPWNIVLVIVGIGLITVTYTLMGGMEAVIWTDVMQSMIMIVGIIVCAGILTFDVFSGSEPAIQAAWDAGKFNFGSWNFDLSSRTLWVMIIYGVTENLRNLIADQNYVQKYSTAPTTRDATRSIWIAMLIYIPLTVIFLYIGTSLFAFYSSAGHALPATITKGDAVFPYFIATEVPPIIKGLVIAAIVAAAMSTVDSALNCSATVSLVDFWKRFFRTRTSDADDVKFLRRMTFVWGLVGTLFALFMIRAQSALDVWWQISGICGGGILGLFLLALFNVPLKPWQGIIAIGFSILVITWGTFWAKDILDGIIVGAVGTVALLLCAGLFVFVNKLSRQDPLDRLPTLNE